MSESEQRSGRRAAYEELPPIRVGWTRLREIGNSPIVKLTIAIPLVGYIIIFNESLLHYLDLSRELFGHHGDVAAANGAHVSWRLLLVYFGLCFVAAGAALYGWYCPDEIKSYRLASDYVAALLSNLGFIGFNRIHAALENGSALAREALHDWQEIQNLHRGGQTQEQWRTATNQGVLELHFDYLNRLHPRARVACAICYVIGFTALFIPSLDVFVRVVRVFARSIFSL